MKYVIGIDGGTQSTKVAIYDLNGNIICEESVKLLPLYIPDAETAEHPNDDLWDSLVKACRALMQKFEGNKEDILGIGLGSIRCCRSYLKEDGSLAYPIINWMDKRLAKPFQNDIPDVAYISTTTGYLTVRLTGQFKDTTANYEGIYGPFDKKEWKWSENPEDYKEYNLTRDMLFDLVMPGDMLGAVTKEASEETLLPEGCPVIATANDKAVEGLGAGIRNDGSVLVSLGTYIGGMMRGKEYTETSVWYWSNLSAIPQEYLYETSIGIRRGMWSISWFKELLGEELEAKAKSLGVSVEQILEGEAKDIKTGSEGLITVGEFLAPNNLPFRKAMIIGFDGRHKRAHMYRSLLEAIAMTMKIGVDAMCDELGVKPSQVIVSGGGSNSPLFMQIFADTFGIKSVRNVVNNAAGLGAAINAAVGVGYYPDYETAINNMVKIRDSYEPNLENTKVYHQVINQVYMNIKEYSDPVNKKIYEIFG
jgi:sugar (pentulose or hexulose) kinase